MMRQIIGLALILVVFAGPLSAQSLPLERPDAGKWTFSIAGVIGAMTDYYLGMGADNWAKWGFDAELWERSENSACFIRLEARQYLPWPKESWMNMMFPVDASAGIVFQKWAVEGGLYFVYENESFRDYTFHSLTMNVPHIRFWFFKGKDYFTVGAFANGAYVYIPDFLDLGWGVKFGERHRVLLTFALLLPALKIYYSLPLPKDMSIVVRAEAGMLTGAGVSVAIRKDFHY